ncbi:hypothetical protein RHDC4_02281 [Rhodocyclaceae bacterium]|nr:hypothetical protein RHDC4_02281 [Rhodocyclaceae bacterium]
MYDAYTGQFLRAGFDGKTAAQEWAKRLVTMDGGQEKWLDLREQSRPIEVDEIEEYKSDRGLSDEGDSADHEFTLEDIEGATGVSAFSVYDDIKAKLIARGVPEHEIEFIHDHDTPQAKEALFKRVNDGSVRYMLGSTPKMGAGTNVQRLLVGEHHIDAPWRPSDLEQREGRIIRRGNLLYERDPEGFEVEMGDGGFAVVEGTAVEPVPEAHEVSASIADDTVVQEARRAAALSEPIMAPEGIEIASAGQHWGKVTAVGNGYVIQDVGRGVLKAHAVANLDRIPGVDGFARIRYSMGKAAVSEVGHGTRIER